MDVTFVGHAGLFVQTRHGSILCDPWFSPAYFHSWFPFPDNRAMREHPGVRDPDYLYVSHQHHDHFDPAFLADCVGKDTTVILPDYPLDLLERALREVGFHRFLHTRNGEPSEREGLTFTCWAVSAPTDGPLGDSSLLIDDGEVRLYDQNDSRPVDLEAIHTAGPYDAHFLQYSGAIWYPMVYRFPAGMKHALGRRKRANQMARALNYVRHVDADFVVPSAGPPCFLDEELFAFNDFGDDEANIFPDQSVFLDYLADRGRAGGRLMLPGSSGSLRPGAFEVTHAVAPDEVFGDRNRAYLEAYAARERPGIAAAKARWPRGEVDIVAALRDWLEPVLAQADHTAVGINGRVVLDCSDVGVVLDFQHRTVYPWDGDQEFDYRMILDRALLEKCILEGYEDWVNELWLSCRFQAERRGPYNDYVYQFFKCLTPERMQYAEGFYAEQAQDEEMWECAGYRIQRRCPHLKADLTRFGRI